MESYLRRLVKIQPIWGRNDIVLFLDSEVSHMPATFQLSYSTSNGSSTAQPRASLTTIFRSDSSSTSTQAGRSISTAAIKRRSILGMFGAGNRTSSVQEDSRTSMEIELLRNGSESFPSEVDDDSNEPLINSSAKVTRRSSMKNKKGTPAAAAEKSGEESPSSNIGGDANLTDSQYSTLFIVGIYLILFLMTWSLLGDLFKFVLHPFK